MSASQFTVTTKFVPSSFEDVNHTEAASEAMAYQAEQAHKEQQLRWACEVFVATVAWDNELHELFMKKCGDQAKF